jgi:HAE1 family hydrophobic/amphiphilic exporter-1
VSQVNVFGTAKFAVHVQLDPQQAGRARHRHRRSGEQSIESHNVNLPSGTLWGPRQAFTVEANGQVMNADAYRPLVVAYRNGSPVRLQDLGDVIDGVQNDKIITWLNNTPSIMFQVMRQPGTNTVDVVDKVNALFRNFARSFRRPSTWRRCTTGRIPFANPWTT